MVLGKGFGVSTKIATRAHLGAMQKTFHVVSLPHTSTTKAYQACAFTEKVRKFCGMMRQLGHNVYLYAGPENEADCTEHIPCITADLQDIALGGNHYTQATFDPHSQLWSFFNKRAIHEIKKRINSGDLICLIGGSSHKVIADALRDNKSIEFGIGYHGVFSEYRVYESYAWMHMHYGFSGTTDTDGNEKFAVIPNYIDLADFDVRTSPDDYFLYVGRMINRKGIHLAASLCQESKKRIIFAGPGDPPEYGEYVGEIGCAERNRLMGGAVALIAPTRYIEPFGTVSIEAMACGTPVISSDWGAFTENIINGVTGFRCRTRDQYLTAIKKCKDLDRQEIADYSRSKFNLHTVAKMYDSYFDSIVSL